MHTLVHHIPEFISLHGSLAPFSQQGLERLNDVITKDYYRNTNHRNDALQSLIMKLNRLEELRDTEEQKPYRKHCCTLCKEPGHNSRTCQLINIIIIILCIHALYTKLKILQRLSLIHENK